MSETKQYSRLATIDFYRGLAIFLMVFIHVIFHTYDYSWVMDIVEENPAGILEIIPFPLLIIFGFIAYLGSWNSFFVMLSALVYALATTKKARKEGKEGITLAKQLVTGLSLVVLGQLQVIFGYWGYLGTCIRVGCWTLSGHFKYSFTVTHTLQLIGWCIILNGIVHYLLMKWNGAQKDTRNMIIYVILAIAVMVATPFIQQYYDSITFESVTLGRWGWVILAGYLQPLFPCLSTSFVGSILGIYLAKPKPKRRFFYWLILASILLIALGVGLIVIGIKTNNPLLGFSLFGERTALTTHLVQMGGQIHGIVGLLIVVEFRNKSEKFANSLPVKYIRRYSIVSLSVYMLDLYELLPRWIITLFIRLFSDSSFNLLNDQIFGRGQELFMLATAVSVILAFDLLIWIWSKINFAGSFEWFLIRLQSLLTNQRSYRINFKLMLNQVNWINLSEIKDTI